MKKIVKVISINDEWVHPNKDSRVKLQTPEISCTYEHPTNWVEVNWGVNQDKAKLTEIGDEYVVTIRKKRWYDRFI